ncbi:MAG: hypothetical protein WD048_05360 [Chitinophagales bacterium]
MDNKLKRYNQKLLAIIGTLVLVGIGMIFLTGGYFLVDRVIRDTQRRNAQDNALTVDGQVETDGTTTKIRKQEISFAKPRLIDTLQSIYLIPVSQVNLENPEIIENEGFKKGSNAYGSRKYSYYRYSGSYNNIIIYNQKNNQKTPVFEVKVNINSFQNYIIQNKQYLFISGTTYDSNKDGKLKDSDLQSFFIYDIHEDKLETVEFEKMGLVDYYILYNTDEIILRFGKDKDENGEFDRYKEPIYMKKYSISENKTIDLINKELTNKLQKLIE